MKRFIYYSFIYLALVFLINLIYTDERGNFLFLLLTFFGLLYNILVIAKTRVLSGKFKLLSAGFIGVTTCFLIFNGGIIPLMYIREFNFINANKLIAFLDNKMLVKFASVTAVGNILYWMGYMSKLGDYLFAIYYEGFGFKKFLQMDINAVFPKSLIVGGLFLNLILFSNGAFGRGIATADNFSGFMKYLVVFSGYIEKLSLIGYFLLALIYFKTKKYKTWYWTTLFLQIFFALVSGARGPIIFLFILTLLPYYYVFRKITVTMLLIGVFTMIFAFTIASEVKRFTQAFDNSSDVSVTEYADAFLDFREESATEFERKIYNSVYYSIMERLNTVAPGSIAIKYKDDHGIDKTDPKFVQELITIPLFTLVPRSKVLNSKFMSWGNWFRIKVLGYSDTYMSNTSFGQVAYFYMGGKWFLVIIGFFVYGMTLRFCNNILELESGISFLIFLAALSAIGYISASVPGSYVSFLRNVIFIPPIFYIVIKLFNRLRL
jgi:hypothetical protein